MTLLLDLRHLVGRLRAGFEAVRCTFQSLIQSFPGSSCFCGNLRRQAAPKPRKASPKAHRPLGSGTGLADAGVVISSAQSAVGVMQEVFEPTVLQV